MNKIKPHILVTGGNSFIAKSMARDALLHHCLPFTFEYKTRKELNVADKKELRDLLSSKEYAYVIHTAVAGNGHVTDTKKDYATNIQMMDNLLSLLDNKKYGRLIVFDSAASFDRDTTIFNRKESHYQSVPKDYYGLAKYNNYQSYKNHPLVTCFRIFNMFGKLELDRRFIKTCIRNCYAEKDILINEDKFFSFFSFDDFANILASVLRREDVEYSKFYELNLCYPFAMRLSHTAAILRDTIGSSSKIIIESDSQNHYHGNGDKQYVKFGFDIRSFLSALENMVGFNIPLER